MTENTTLTVEWTAEERAALTENYQEMLRMARRRRDDRVRTRESFKLQASNAFAAGDEATGQHKMEIVCRLTDEITLIGGDIAWALGRLADAGYPVRPNGTVGELQDTNA